MKATSTKGPILVAMSGGVDSGVAAALLVRRGYEVIGLTMQIWQESQTDPRHAGCCSLGAVEDARRTARALGIPHYVMNFREEFRRSVIDNFIDEYGRGRTPNPCVQCNRHVKFEILLGKMRELGCARLATGHYARIRRHGGVYRLLQARALDKDQSYVLYMLGQEQLSQICFPMGELESKARARHLAAEMGLPIADKPDSQEICFVSEAGGYTEFLKKQRAGVFRAGQIVDREGRHLGEHEGVAGYTVGQRRGIGVSSRSGRPLYVLELRPEANQVIVGEEADLLAREVSLSDLHWPSGYVPSRPVSVNAKIRYNMAPAAATLCGSRLIFDEPVRAATPGQIAVAYRGKSVVAGGIIDGASP